MPANDACIVLPFRDTRDLPFNGTGLALHFLVANFLVLHTGFSELWFGSRVKRIFSEEATFQRYCRYSSDAADIPDLIQVSQSQQVRFWLQGSLADQAVSLHLWDARAPHAVHPPVDLPISIEDNLIGLRRHLLKWLQSIGRPMPQAQVQAALWPETIGPEGLDAVGRALERFYIFSAYGDKNALDLSPFAVAVSTAPKSFMAHNLLGWAHYRNRNYPAARDALLASLKINPAGVGPMSGLMWCGVYGKDLEQTLLWSSRKAGARHEDTAAARAQGLRRYEKANACPTE
jgi:hypothetical protein